MFFVNLPGVILVNFLMKKLGNI